MTALALFASSFVLVFALGFQSLNVNNGHYWAAATTSVVIGSMQMVLLQLGPDASTIQIAAAIAGGPLGIVCSMWAHRRTVGRRARSSVVWTEVKSGKVPRPHDWPAPPDESNINCGADRP